ncbi:hypothetical protein LSAT2_026631 [Lamellibrachia satsuma]|nr:hypothetical protein LSAT2_026631 [Lamellibrachia satsuma]
MATDCVTTGVDLIVNAETECSLPATVNKTFGRVSIDGRLLIHKGTDGQYATLRANRDVVISSTGVLTATGQGFRGGEGPGHGVTRDTSGTGGKSRLIH